MKRRIMSGVLVALALSAAGAFAASSASADTPAMQASVGSPITVANRLLVSVPVEVVCDEIGNPGDITLADSVTVTVSQANGKSVSTGMGQVAAGPNSMYNPSSPGFLTCDGATVNHVTVPVQGNGPFHGGGGVVSVNTYHSVGTCFFPGFCSTTTYEQGSTGPLPVSFQGGGK